MLTADYLRDLSVSYERMGDLLRALGQGEAARQYYQKALDIRQRLVDQEPERADSQIDLVISLARTVEGLTLERGLTILSKMKVAGRLIAQDESKIEALRNYLQALQMSRFCSEFIHNRQTQ